MTDSDARLHMVAGQLRPNKVNEDNLISALSAVQRELFVPKAMKGCAYADKGFKIADDRHMFEPMVFARLLKAADIAKTDLVLEIGSGTGYGTAVLAKLAEMVVSLEDNAELASKASDKITDAGVDNAAIITGPLNEGVAKQGPYNVIFINGAVEEISPSLTDQLADNGRLVCLRVENGVCHGHLIIKTDNELHAFDMFDADAPVLSGFKKTKVFNFKTV
jgi:protein-L-isoaspartate(D-aspartate) O-methyltransferase